MRMEGDDWEPISAADLSARVSEEAKELTAEDRERFETWRAEPGMRASIFRSESHGAESVYVLAKVGSSVLFFDDVEDEFAVGRLGDDGLISSPGLAGELRSALQSLSLLSTA